MVIESPYPFVCVSVTKVVIVNYGQMVRVGMYGSKDSKSRRTSKLHDRFKSNHVFENIFCP